MSPLRNTRLLSRRGQHLLTRPFSATVQRQSAWTPMPSPPRLPKEEQELFEKLQQQSTGAFSTPREDQSQSERRTPPQVNQSPDSASTESAISARVQANGDGEELHPNVRRGAPPEFEGETNPKTGEVGGPKNEPLRWGHGGDWSYNGRVTDF
ncbi:DUF1674-domain-containing protein [Myriangium duriaei CBS 260.36]|uniref:Succinate dehydrogenase assembly factor 4, mitochondrial n=1 Tax=Myriangium duriaei CBS 260.36 TaxID=1168546 RepID=A0A9P4J552_9PEZI|nr:DUF1674-domain-containing protein [Myriangium duriaei CBS 260.36]